MKRLFVWMVCLVRGHDYGNVINFSPSILTCCHRCGKDIHGRSVADLEPMKDEDYEYLDYLISMDLDKD